MTAAAQQAVGLTAFGSDDDATRGLRAGYDYYLTKPLILRHCGVLAEG